MIQLILHLVGDYVTQSQWMSDNKTKRRWPAFCHALVYSLPFLLIGSLSAFAVILSTHFLIDRFRLARYVVWAKNIVFSPVVFGRPCGGDFGNQSVLDAEIENYERQSAPLKWANCKATGYPSELPAWLAVPLMIACDNTMHLLINWLALRYL